MEIDQLYYELPKELIAQYPAERREQSRLMVLYRQQGCWEHRRFYELTDLLKPGDILVLNNTKVFPARLLGQKANSQTKVELLLTREISPNRWEALIRPSRRLPPHTRIIFGQGDLEGTVISKGELGKGIIEFSSSGDIREAIYRYGLTPLPPYIKREGQRPLPLDQSRYQTVYAQIEGSVAAPTAGLHFSQELLKELENKGIEILYITLHIGPGTFRPIKSKQIEQHRMEPEYYRIDQETADKIRSGCREGRRIIAVGTSVTKALETIFPARGALPEILQGWSDLFIYPGYRFKLVDALITNFHLPGSTLLALVAAFAGRDLILRAYQAAIDQGYRFYSYGDAMLIL